MAACHHDDHLILSAAYQKKWVSVVLPYLHSSTHLRSRREEADTLLLDPVDSDGCNLVHYAARDDRVDVLTHLATLCTPSRYAEACALPSSSESWVPAHFAALHGCLAVLRHFFSSALVAEHAPSLVILYRAFFHADDQGQTPLHVAVWNSHLHIVEFYCMHSVAGVNTERVLSLQNAQGIAPAHLILQSGSLTLSSSTLLAKRIFAEMDSDAMLRVLTLPRGQEDGYSPIHIAALAGPRCLDFLLFVLETMKEGYKKDALLLHCVHGTGCAWDLLMESLTREQAPMQATTVCRLTRAYPRFYSLLSFLSSSAHHVTQELAEWEREDAFYAAEALELEEATSAHAAEGDSCCCLPLCMLQLVLQHTDMLDYRRRCAADDVSHHLYCHNIQTP